MSDSARYLLKSRALSVEIAPRLGGRVTRFWWHDGDRNIDIFQPIDASVNDPNQSITGGCFVLLPFSNRIANGVLNVPGQGSYPLTINEPGRGHTIHGHGRRQAWQVMTYSDDVLDLAYSHAAGDDGWIWPYQARMRIKLLGNQLIYHLSVTNHHAQLQMPAGLGLHPYFPRPQGVRLKAKLDDIWPADECRIPEGPAALPADLAFAAEAVLPAGLDVGFGGWSGPAELHWPGSRPAVEIRADAVFSHLIIFTPPKSDFFCVEPVSHAVDGFNAAGRGVPGSGLHMLASGECLQGEICFRVRPEI